MKRMQTRSVLVAGALAVMSVSALAQMTPGPRDPYTQGAAAGTLDPSTSGARAGDKFDPYTQGAAQSTRQDLAPQPQTYQPTPVMQDQPAYGRAAYRGDMAWASPNANLGQRVGMRNLFLDGA